MCGKIAKLFEGSSLARFSMKLPFPRKANLRLLIRFIGGFVLLYLFHE